MKKIAISLVLLFVAISFCYAQGAPTRQLETLWGQNSGGGDSSNRTANLQTTASGSTSNFTNIAISGQDVAGTPAYIALASVGFNGAPGSQILYYLWIDEDGDLLIASRETLEQQVGFPSGNWEAIKDTITGVATIGEQT